METKINIDELICSLMESPLFPDDLKGDIKFALSDQGLCYRDNRIVYENIHLQEGKWYICTQWTPGFTVGNLYQCTQDNYLKSDLGGIYSCHRILNYFRPATVEEIMNKLDGIQKEKVTQKTPLEIEDGKWYVCTKKYFCGGKIQANVGDIVQAKDGMEMMDLKDGSEYFRKWEIEDAVNGDILTAKDGRYIVIFHELLDDYSGYFAAHCYYDKMKDAIKCDEESQMDGLHFVPATHEDKAILFREIHIVGYEWNAEAKKLSYKFKQTDCYTEEMRYSIPEGCVAEIVGNEVIIKIKK